MTDHVHSWTPIPLVVARYECSCGATGRRDKSGAIVEVRQLREAVRALTDRVAQLEARLAAADPGVDHPRRPRGRG